MKFSDKLIDWYCQNKRDLPWRNTKDAYKIWVSEVVLQQTRVDQGLDYYKRIIKKYPDIVKLASASEEDLLKLWQGLGYYSRARNMHKAAKEIIAEYDGVLPDTFNELIKIKGIGKYTASAILSFAYDLPYPVLDGNVKRILSRYYCITSDIGAPATEKELNRKLEKIFDKKRAADFNQAIMDFGALHCKINNPDCQSCVFNDKCKAFLTGRVSELPFIAQKQKVKTRYFYYLIPLIKLKGKYYTYLEKRESEDIWKHLYQFPLVETEKEHTWESLLNSSALKKLLNINRVEMIGFSEKFAHKLTHQLINAVFIQLKTDKEFNNKKLLKININDLKNYPVSRLTDKYLKQNLLSGKIK